MKSLNSARLGVIAYAVFAAALPLALKVWLRARLALAAATDDYRGVPNLRELIEDAELAVVIGVALAFWAIARDPKATKTRSFAIAASLVTAFDFVVEVAWRLWSVGREDFEYYLHVYKLTVAVHALTWVATSILFARIALRIADVGSVRFVRPLVAIQLGAVLASAMVHMMWIADSYSKSLSVVLEVGRYVGLLASLGIAVLVARSLSRMPDRTVAPDLTVAPSAERSRLDPEWRVVGSAITAYLFALGVRVLVLLIGFVAVNGGGGRTSSHGNRADAAIGVFFLFMLSSLISAVMLFAVSRFRRAPSWRAERATNVALGLMAVGLLLELITAAITASTLDGSISAAFFARDALLILVPLGTWVALAGGAALLSVFATLAADLNLWDAAKAARKMVKVVLIAGSVAALALLTVSILPASLFALIAIGSLIAIVPATFHFVSVGVQLIREIDARTGQPQT
jgi:hypothetical protein